MKRVILHSDMNACYASIEAKLNPKLKITTADSGASIITAAKKLLKAGAQENKKKKSLADMDDSIFIESDTPQMLPETSGNNSQASDTATEEK